MLGKPVYDPVAGRYIGYDCAVYADSLLGPGSVFGVEALAQGIVGDPAASLPRLHTATTFTQTTVLMLPLSVLRACTLPHAKLSKEIEGLSTQRYAELACIQQGLSRTPIFSTLPPLKLLALAKHFTLKILEPADRIATEGERFSAFVVLLHGKLIISKRTAWGRMRKTLGANTSGATVFGGRKQQAEIVVKSMRHGDKMPFVGESVLSETKPREQRELEVAPTTVRAAERTTVLYLPRDAAALFNMEWDQFSDLLLQRQQVLMQNSMHNVAMTAAIDKHKEDLANPSPELMEALALAKKANHRRPGRAFATATSQAAASACRRRRTRSGCAARWRSGRRCCRACRCTRWPHRWG